MNTILSKIALKNLMNEVVKINTLPDKNRENLLLAELSYKKY